MTNIKAAMISSATITTPKSTNARNAPVNPGFEAALTVRVTVGVTVVLPIVVVIPVSRMMSILPGDSIIIIYYAVLFLIQLEVGITTSLL